MEVTSIYTLQDVPGKGKGLVALEDIPKGTRILSEQPVITLPERQQSDDWLKRHIIQQVDSLNEHERESFLSLHNIYPYNGMDEQSLGIVRTNALPIEANKTGAGVFLKASRINHSCDNNAQKDWNNRIKRHIVHALRDIPKGEEITIYYLGLDSSREVRRKKLSDKFGFLCACRLCSLPTAESQENDQRLERIAYLDDIVGRECMSMNFSLQTLRYVDERVQLYNKQGPGNAGLPRAYFDAAQIAIANGDLARGRVFAERAVAGWKTAGGSDSDEVIQFTPIAQDPTTYPLYGISMKWKTQLEEGQLHIESNDFEDWLWRREQPRIIELSGRFTNLRNREIFPDFANLPESSRVELFGHQSSEETHHPSRHWCFLGEITGSTILHHLELAVRDVGDNIIPLHFNTDSRGNEITTGQIQNGYTVAVLYAKRHVFIYGDPGIKHMKPQMLKIFPVSLKNLLGLSDRIQQFSDDKDGIKTCHGCGKKAPMSNRCGRCSLFWYCDRSCQKSGWIERGHKLDCRLLKDPDLRGLFVLEWDNLATRVKFPLTIPGTA